MKYLKSYNESLFSVRKDGIDKICKKYKLVNYTINDDLTVDVNGDVNLSNVRVIRNDIISIGKLPIKFNKVSGYFIITNLELKTLEGSPKYVGGAFDCSINNLESLEFGPKYVGGSYDASSNNIKTLKHAEDIIILGDESKLVIDINLITNVTSNQIELINLNTRMGIGYNPFQIFMDILELSEILDIGEYFDSNKYIEMTNRLEEFEVIKGDNIIDMISLNSLFDYYNTPFNLNEEYIEITYNELQDITEGDDMAFNKFYTFS